MTWAARAQALRLEVSDFVNGRRCVSEGNPLREKWSPRDGTPLYRFHDSTGSEVREAVGNARATIRDGRWAGLSVQQRKDVLYKLARLIEQNRDELALLEGLDVGKPITDALNIDVPTAATIIRATAEAIDYVSGKVYLASGTNLAYQLQRPVGVVAGLIGWNFPLILAATKIAPALAAGNSLVLKPSELTPLSAIRLAELALEAGVPPGVLNVVNGGAEVGEVLASHHDVDLMSFTGSTRTGKMLLVAAGQSNMKRVILECGGKAPNIVFEDAPDLDAVATAVVERAFWNQGQVCTASSRLLVQASIKDALLERVVAKARLLAPGDPLEESTRFGALVSAGHRDKVLSYIDRGAQEGAAAACRAEISPPFAQGFYVAPVIFDRVSPGMAIAQEEIFGPVLAVLTFKDTEEAIQIANDSLYGLSAIAWTRDLARVQRLSYALQSGSVTVFATAQPAPGPGEGVLTVGGLKQSGIGVEGGLEGIQAYMTQTAVQLYA